MIELGRFLELHEEFGLHLLRNNRIRLVEDTAEGHLVRVLGAFRNGVLLDPLFVQSGVEMRAIDQHNRLFKATFRNLLSWAKAVRYRGVLAIECYVSPNRDVRVAKLRGVVPAYLDQVIAGQSPEMLRKGVVIGLGPDYAVTVTPLHNGERMQYLERLSLINRSK